MDKGNVSVQGTNYGVIAHGKNKIKNRVDVKTGPDPEVGRLIVELERAVEDHRRELDHAAELKESIAEVRRQASKNKPKRGLLRTLLNGIAAGAGSVGAVAEAATKVKSALGL